MYLKKVTGLLAILTISVFPSLLLAAEEAKPVPAAKEAAAVVAGETKAAEEASTAESLAKANAKLESSYDSGKPKIEEVPAGVNQAVAAGTEEAKKLEAAAKEAAATIPVNPAWDKIKPAVEIVKWGPEFRIKVKTNPNMKKERMMAIKSVKLETLKGEFLGLKTYTAEEQTRDAEFMVNADILKIDTVKITVVSPEDGDYVTVSALKVTETPEMKKEAAEAAAKLKESAEKAAPAVEAAAAQAEVPAEKPVEAPKKKKGWW